MIWEELGLQRRREEAIFFGFPFKQREGKEEEKKIQVWNFGLELLYLLVWNLFVWICWLENSPNSLFAYVWGLKNLISVYKLFVLVLVQFCGWFESFSYKFWMK